MNHNNNLLKKIKKTYSTKKTPMDLMEKMLKKTRENILGVNKKIFLDTINFYEEVYNQKISEADALYKALNKPYHKQTWFEKERKSIKEKMHFYNEVHFYPFFQPYKFRFGGLRWYIKLVSHKKSPSILEYGCGSANTTEYLLNKYPNFNYDVADIPSVTLEFVKWKKNKHNYKHNILTIGEGKEGIPLKKKYDLIICKDVLEHTPNPLDIVQSFFTHLNSGGVLLIDFINAPGGENLLEAVNERDTVLNYLNENFVTVKAIDENDKNDGLYIKEY